MSTEQSVAHTPGPWYSNVNDLVGGWIVATVDLPASEVNCEQDREVADLISNEANARLIAAAPELLAALKEVVAIADRQTVEFDKAHAVIAKAEGRS